MDRPTKEIEMVQEILKEKGAYPPIEATRKILEWALFNENVRLLEYMRKHPPTTTPDHR